MGSYRCTSVIPNGAEVRRASAWGVKALGAGKCLESADLGLGLSTQVAVLAVGFDEGHAPSF